MTIAALINLKLLDDRNIDLYTGITCTQTIETSLKDLPYYETYTRGNYAEITVAKNKLSAASYTHELLHIYLRTKGVVIGDSLISSIKSKPKLRAIFSELRLEEMTNSIDHIKMLPIYLELGYPIEEFISDFDVSQFSLIDLGIIMYQFKNRKWFSTRYNSRGIEQYISKFFVANAAPNPMFDYSFQLKSLNKLDRELYEILDIFLGKWKEYNYEDEDFIDRSYYRFSIPFVEKLNDWASTKSIE